MAELENDRNCFMCERAMPIVKNENGDAVQQGYHCCDEYFCDDRCLNKSFLNSGEEWDTHYGDDHPDCYWTEWELEYKSETEAIA